MPVFRLDRVMAPKRIGSNREGTVFKCLKSLHELCHSCCCCCSCQPCWWAAKSAGQTATTNFLLCFGNHEPPPFISLPSSGNSAVHLNHVEICHLIEPYSHSEFQCWKVALQKSVILFLTTDCPFGWLTNIISCISFKFSNWVKGTSYKSRSKFGSFILLFPLKASELSFWSSEKSRGDLPLMKQSSSLCYVLFQTRTWHFTWQ